MFEFLYDSKQKNPRNKIEVLVLLMESIHNKWDTFVILRFVWLIIIRLNVSVTANPFSRLGTV